MCVTTLGEGPVKEMDCESGLNRAASSPRCIQTRPSAHIAKPPTGGADSFRVG